MLVDASQILSNTFLVRDQHGIGSTNFSVNFLLQSTSTSLLSPTTHGFKRGLWYSLPMQVRILLRCMLEHVS
ncbi:hypothetical protein AHAS_Ahas13G0278500 [Arachis hypogaea]